MFPKFYIKNSILLLFVIALLFVELFAGARAFSILLLIFGSILLAYRKNAPFYQDFLSRGQGTFLAPVSAEVKGTKDCFFSGLGQSYRVCEFRMPWYTEFGLYFPMNAEVKSLQETTLRMPSFSKKQKEVDDFAELYGQLIGFNNRELGDFFLFASQDTVWSRPRIFVRVGDRGKRGANLGFLPFGGNVHMLFPLNTEIFIKPGDKIDPMGTFVAGLKGSMT